jgi:hypothetical protein
MSASWEFIFNAACAEIVQENNARAAALLDDADSACVCVRCRLM